MEELILDDTEVFIPFNIPSSKNSKIATKKGVFHSKTVTKYLRTLGIQHYSAARKEVKEYKTKPNLFRAAFSKKFLDRLKKITKPIKLGFFFIRDSNRKADFHNIVQLPLDLMTAHGFIEDDDMTNVLPYPLEKDKKLGFKVDKNNPGCIIKININEGVEVKENILIKCDW